MTQTCKVLVSDKMSEAGLAPVIENDDIDVDILTTLSPAELIETIGPYHALMVRSSTQVTAEVIAAGKNLRVIARAGVGVDNVDIPAATQAGIIVVNAPTGNTRAAAEHTIAMMMAQARNIPQADAHVRSGEWKRSQFVGIEVRGKTLGTIGFGRVAQEVAGGAQGLGMKVIASDPYVTQEFAAQRNVTLTSLEEVVKNADFLTIHVPKTKENVNLIGRKQIASMKPTARILNVARGGVLDETALVEALKEGRLAGAALDVFESEPLPAISPLFGLPNVILTPHLGASTEEAQVQVAEDVAIQVVDILNDRPPRHAVNAPIIPSSDLDFLMPYIDLAERIGHFARQVGPQNVSELEVTAYGRLAVFELDHIKAAVLKGLLGASVEVRINLVNAGLIADQRGLTITENKISEHDMRYKTMLAVTTRSGDQQLTTRGSMIEGTPNIVAIDDLWVDFFAKGHLLVSRHQDCPGIIGRVGTELGQSDINVSFMYVGRHAPRTTAIMILGTDEKASDSLLRTIEEFDKIDWVKPVTL